MWSRKAVIKLGLFLTGFFVVWRLWESDAAINAVVLFCTAGVVPLTHQVLTPEQVYIVLGCILFISVMLIFWKQVARDVRAIRNAFRRKSSIEDDAYEITVMDEPREDEPSAPTVVAADSRAPGRFTMLWRRVRPRLIVAVGASLARLIKIGGQVTLHVSRVMYAVYGQSVRLWLWAEPHLRRFDAWLEKKLKANKDFVALLHVVTESSKLLRTRSLDLRARLIRVLRVPEK